VSHLLRGQAAVRSTQGAALASPRRYVLALALLTAGLAGVVEAAIKLLVLRDVYHRPIHGDAHLLWMIPLGYLAIVAVPAVILIVFAGWSRYRSGVVVATTSLLWIGCFGVLLLQPNLHPAALAVLALGVALVAARRLSSWDGLERWMSRLAVVAVAVPVLTGVVLQVGETRVVDQYYASLPTPPAEPRNDVLLVWDTDRGAIIGHLRYYPPTTPRLDRLARSCDTIRNA
jgi:hypothetical protein